MTGFLPCFSCQCAGVMNIPTTELLLYSTPSCSASRPAGRMAIHTMEAKGFHNNHGYRVPTGII